MEQFEGYKKCYKCQCILPIMMFYNNKSTKDGLGRECKDCIGEYEQTDTYKRNRKKYMQSESYKEAEVRGNKKYMQIKKGKESAKRRKWRYLQTANGKKHKAKIDSIRNRNLGFVQLFDNLFTCDVDWHHISDAFVVALPRKVHKEYIGYPSKKHRDLLKPIVEEYYEMSYVIISNVVTI